MEFEWDEAKRISNLVKHGVDFELAHSFDWSDATIETDLRKNYGEDRFIARGMASDNFGYHIAFTFRGRSVRIITMRRFNQRDYSKWNVTRAL